MGNSVLVVEHDEDTMRNADFIVDIRPYSGVNGGEVIATGTIDDICKSKKSITGKYLSKELVIDVPKSRRKPIDFITIKSAAENDLKNIDVDIPLSVFICVIGVSGSGKSSLINEVLYKSLSKSLNNSKI